MKRGSLPLWAGTVLFALAGLGFLWGAWALADDLSRFLAHSRPALGTIVSYRTESSTSKDRGTSISHYPTIGYDDGAGSTRTFEAEQTLDPDESPVGDTVDILVSTDGRHHDQINSPDSLWVNPILLAFFGVLCLGAALLIYFLMILEVEVRAEVLVFWGFLAGALLFGTVTWAVSGDSLWLSAHGQRTEGRVVSHQGAPEVGFTAPDGRVYHRQTRVGGDHLPAYGATLPVLYDPAHPGRARVAGFDDLWFATGLTGGFTGLCAVVAVWVFFGLVLPGRGRSAGARLPRRGRVGGPGDFSAAQARLGGPVSWVVSRYGPSFLQSKTWIQSGDILLTHPSSYQELFDTAVARTLLFLQLSPAQVKVTRGPHPGTVSGPDGTLVLTLQERLSPNPYLLVAELVNQLCRHKLLTDHQTEDPEGLLAEVVATFFGFGLFSGTAAGASARFGGLPGMGDGYRGSLTVGEHAYLLARWLKFRNLEPSLVLPGLDFDLAPVLKKAWKWVQAEPASAPS